MQISDEAKKIILEMLEEENKNALTIEVIGKGCHKQLSIDFTIVDEAPQINDIYVVMDSLTAQLCENIVLDAKEGNLMYRSTCSSGCANCQGCK